MAFKRRFEEIKAAVASKLALNSSLNLKAKDVLTAED